MVFRAGTATTHSLSMRSLSGAVRTRLHQDDPGAQFARYVTVGGISSALYALLYDFVRANGPERLLELAPTFAYVTLAPFLGAEKAYAAAVD